MNKLWLLPWIVFLMSCAGGAPPETEYYLLRGESPTVVRSGPIMVALGRIGVAAYIDQSGLILETRGNVVEAARYHLWAEPIGQGIRSLLRGNVSRELGFHVSARSTVAHEYVVHVYVDQLHSTAAGDAALVADVDIDREGVLADGSRVAMQQQISYDGYAAMVEAEIALVGRLANSVAQHLNALASG